MFDFQKLEKGILLCTDIAARGLDIPAVVLFFSYSTNFQYTHYII